MPRLHLFEFNEQPWVPPIIRDLAVECLPLIVGHSRIMQGMIPPLDVFLSRTKATRILDLCSGAGGLATMFAEQMRQSRTATPEVVLTDLFPRVETWKALCEADPDALDFCAEPVDATSIPARVSQGSARMINNAFHHFRPQQAQAILRDAVEHSEGIFVTEIFPRSFARSLSLAWSGTRAALVNPFVTREHGLAKGVLTWLFPVGGLAFMWDGLVSILRIYTEKELREMVAPLGDRFEWVYGTFPYRPFGLATYFYGVPAEG